MEKVNKILEWAKFKKWFDTSFVESVSLFYSEVGYITPAQDEALDRIIEKCKIK